MRSARQALRILACLALVAFALPLLLRSQSVFFCRMSGQVMSACCCASHGAPRHVPSSKLLRGDCCERISQAAQAPAQRAGYISAAVTPAALFTVLPRIELAALARVSAVRASLLARGPPREGPPIYLENRVWLI